MRHVGCHSHRHDGTVAYLPMSSQTPGAAAEAAANRKITKYASLTQSYSFIPIAEETMGAINSDGIEFLGELRRRITRITDDKRESAFPFQSMSVVIQRYNAVAIQGTFAHTTPENDF